MANCSREHWGCWLKNGLWAGYGSLYAHLPLLLGRDEKVADLIYAIANHASPTGGWVEEQSAVGDPMKLAGDQPHCWPATCASLSFPSEATTRCRGPRAVRTVSQRC